MYLHYHLAELIYPRLKSYVHSYRSGKFTGLCPGIIIQEYKDQLISEGFTWDASRHYFVESQADERLKEIWFAILESMVFSFEWIATGEPLPEYCFKPNPFYKPKAEFLIPIPGEDNYQINPAHGAQKIDVEAYKQFSQKIQAGFDNFGKYYQHLWD